MIKVCCVFFATLHGARASLASLRESMHCVCRMFGLVWFCFVFFFSVKGAANEASSDALAAGPLPKLQ